MAFLLYRKLLSCKVKNAPRGCALRRIRQMSQAAAAGARECARAHSLFIYRKFLKSSEIVYNRLEIKNDMTKERRGLRHDVVYEVFCFGLE